LGRMGALRKDLDWGSRAFSAPHSSSTTCGNGCKACFPVFCSLVGREPNDEIMSQLETEVGEMQQAPSLSSVSLAEKQGFEDKVNELNESPRKYDIEMDRLTTGYKEIIAKNSALANELFEAWEQIAKASASSSRLPPLRAPEVRWRLVLKPK
jgi:hypothetical protein